MNNRVDTAWRSSLLAPLLSATLRVVLVSADVDDAAHFLSDVSSRLGTPGTIGGKAIVDGVLTADPTNVSSGSAGNSITGYVVYEDTGTESTSRIITVVGKGADTVPFLVDTGNTKTIHWPSGRVVKV